MPSLETIFLLGQETQKQTLDDSMRAAWVLALIGIVSLGFGMMVVVWLFGRMYRRWMGSDEPLPPSGADHLGLDWSSSKGSDESGT